MHQPHKEDTKQERYLTEALEGCGYSFVIQCDWFVPYIVDFYLPELRMVIEADGKVGHLRKADAKRDAELLAGQEIQVSQVVHISATDVHVIMEELCQVLDKL